MGIVWKINDLLDLLKNTVLAFMVISFAPNLWAQEDIASREDMLVEQQHINFQTFFFEGLQQRAIGNFDKAIYALEACANIEKENTAVQFELSKNYASLFKYTEAEYYILKGLEQDPENLYMLRHLKEIKTRQNDYTGAIVIQERILKQKPEEESELVLLYIKSGEIEKASALLKRLDEQHKLPEGLKPLKVSLFQEYSEESNDLSESNAREAPQTKTELLKEGYRLKQDMNSLKLLLDREWKTKQILELLKDSEEGLELFPAQPYLYLMNARAFNSLRKHQEALNRLDEGLDLIIEDDELKADFYDEMSLGHKGLGNNRKATEYDEMARQIRNKR